MEPLALSVCPLLWGWSAGVDIKPLPMRLRSTLGPFARGGQEAQHNAGPAQYNPDISTLRPPAALSVVSGA